MGGKSGYKSQAATCGGEFQRRAGEAAALGCFSACWGCGSQHALPLPSYPKLGALGCDCLSSLQPSLETRLLCRENHSSPILNLGHLLPGPSCHTAPLRLRCTGTKPRLPGDSCVLLRGASRQQREGDSLQLSNQDTTAMGRCCHVLLAAGLGWAGLSPSQGPCST